MSQPADPIDAARCLLCGADNRCAMAGGQGGGLGPSPCWCTQAHFSEGLLQGLPDAARGAACICPACAAAAPRRA